MDGHHRYKIFRKHNIEFNIEEISLSKDSEKSDAMDWMLTHQLSSKNLSVGEKLAMTEEFQEEVRLENEKKKLEGNSKGGKSNKEVTLQLECDLKNDNTSRSETWTDNQIAKKLALEQELLLVITR